MMEEFKEIEPRPILLFHHSRKIEHCHPGDIFSPALDINNFSEVDKRFYDPYKWMEEQLGFTPVFLAVGAVSEVFRLTGYPLNEAMFSFKSVTGVYSDYQEWESVLYGRNRNPSTFSELVFHPERTQEQWVELSLKHPKSVQLMTPSVNLDTAHQITVPSNFQKRELMEKGFNPKKIAVKLFR